MKQIHFRLALLVSQMIVITCVSGKRMLMLQKSPNHAVTTAKIIKSCYEEHIKVVGLAGNFSDSFMTSLSSDDRMSMIMINFDEEAVQSEVVTEMTRYKLQMFTITAPSPIEFKKILLRLESSRWWNHLAKFYVFHSSDEETGCSEAFQFLWTAWMMDILKVKFLCNPGNERPLIYMFNPYTNYAPAPWTLERTTRGINNHPWTLFVREYNENVDICKNIDFDQTKDAGGYEVRLTAVEGSVNVNPAKNGELSPFPVTNSRLLMFSRYMNIKFKMMICPKNLSFGYVDEDGKGHGQIADLTDGRSDMVSQIVPISAVPELPATHEGFGKLFAVTQYTGYPSQWEKVITAIDFPSRIGVLIVTITTVIFLKYALRQSFIVAALNSFRVIICNGCFTKLPNNLGPRFYLICLFSFVIIIQALYQGQLAARLSAHVRYPNVNNNRDLMESNYILYGRENDGVIFSDQAFEGRFVPFNFFANSCTDQVLRNSSIACINGREYLTKKAIESKLHMSKNLVAEFPMKNVMRKNWPLESRYNRQYSRYVASGLSEHNSVKPFMMAFRTLDFNENGRGDDSFKILYIEDLAFAFVILGIGLSSAMICFFIELLVARSRSARAKHAVQLPCVKKQKILHLKTVRRRKQ